MREQDCLPVDEVGHYGENVIVEPDRPVGGALGELRKMLAPLSDDEDQFVSWATARAAPRPPNYVEIIRANMGRTDVPLLALRQLEVGPQSLLGLVLSEPGYASRASEPTPRQEREMELPEDVIEDVRKRLHRVVGQVQGVERMLDEGRGAATW